MAEKDQKELAKVYFSIMIGRLFFYLSDKISKNHNGMRHYPITKGPHEPVPFKQIHSIFCNFHTF